MIDNTVALEAPARIQQIHAYIQTDTKGVENIGTFISDGKEFPMVFIDENMLKYFTPYVEKLRRDGLKVVLARFTVRTDLDEVPTP